MPADCATAYTASTANSVKVTVAEPFTFLTPGLAALVGNFTMTASATSASLGAAGLPATAAPCVSVPNVVGLAPAAAVAALEAKGLVPNGMDDLTSGTRNQVQTQAPAAATCVNPATTPITFHYRP